jgi:hypothetical protein
VRPAADSRERTRRLLWTLLLSAAATLVNPLGPGLWLYVLRANGRPGQAQITEWASAFELLDSGVLTWTAVAAAYWLLLAASIALWVRRRRRLDSWDRRVPVYATVAMAPLAALAVRNVPYFVIAVLPLLMTLGEFRTAQEIGRVRRHRPALAAVAVLTLLTTGLVWARPPSTLGWHPVDAALARALRSCPGPLYNTYDSGAALIWWVPSVKVFVDNRQDPYPKDVIDPAFELSTDDYPSVFTRFDVRCALLGKGSDLVPALERAGWAKTYAGGGSVVLALEPPRAIEATE